jgi:hypothetical protein
MTLPPDPFGRSRLPGDFTREGRVGLIAECATALLDGRMPSREAAMFLAGGVLSWLQCGGRIGALERDYWRVAAPERSTATPARVYARSVSARRATDDEDTGSMVEPSPDVPT